MSDKYKTGECRKFTFWAVYDATSAQKYIKMDVDTGCLAIFDVEGRAAGFASDCPGAACGKLVLYSCPQPAEQQPAPEVAMLVEALESLMKGYASLLEGGIDRITHLSGDCDLIPDMLRNAREALAAHRKQGGES